MAKKAEGVVEITNENILCETKFLELKEVDYIDNGEQKKWSYVSRKKTNGIVAIIAKKGYRFLFIVQKRIPVNKNVISFPSGLIDLVDDKKHPGKKRPETPREAAARELTEETGYIINKVISISPLLPKSAGLTNESVYIVQCTVKDKHGDPTDPTEGIIPFWMSPKKLMEHVKELDKNENAVESMAWTFISGYIHDKKI